MANNSSIELLNKGMKCLVKQLGVVEAEKFIAIVHKEKFDYTKWQKTLFDDMMVDEMLNAAAAFDREHPFTKKEK